MTLNVGSDKIVEIRKGGQKIAKVYKGSTLVFGYPAGKVLFESGTPNTYTLNIKFNCKIQVWMVGAGSGGCWGITEQYGDTKKGNQGAYISGTTSIEAGTYTIVVGKGGNGASGVYIQTSGSGTASSFAGNIAGGATGNTAFGAWGVGGTATIASSGLTGSNGATGNTTDRYLTYGGGGDAKYITYAYAGHDGYVKIVAV